MAAPDSDRSNKHTVSGTDNPNPLNSPSLSPTGKNKKTKKRRVDIAMLYEGRATIPHGPNDAAYVRAHIQQIKAAEGGSTATTEDKAADVTRHYIKGQLSTFTKRWQSNQILICHRGKIRDALTSFRYRLRHLPRFVSIGFATVGIIAVIVFVAYMSLQNQVATLRKEALAATSSLSDLNTAINARDITSATTAVNAISSHAQAMRELTSGPLWTAASVFPGISDEATCARSLANSFDRLIEGVVTPTLSVARGRGSLSFLRSGGVDADLLIAVVDSLSSSSIAIQEVRESLDSLPQVDSADLMDACDAATQLASSLDKLSSFANEIAPHLTSLLGTKTTRNYLIVVMNCAQMRSIGGVPYCEILLTVDDGELTLGEPVATDATFGSLWYSNSLEVTDEEVTLFGSEISQYPYAMARIPDFPRAAELLDQDYEKELSDGTVVDGVIAMDPIMVQDLLGLAGSLTLDDGTLLDSTNTASYLLHDLPLYSYTSTEEELFAETCGEIFNTFLDKLRSVDQMALTDVASECSQAGRFYVWFSSDSDEKLMTKLGCSGALLDDQETPELGVYLNDMTGGVIDWYLDVSTEVGEAKESSRESTSWQLTTTITNTLTDEDVSDLWSYYGATTILGTSYSKWSNSDAVVSLYLIAPKGATITDLSATGGFSDYFYPTEATYDGYDVIYGTLHIYAEDTISLTYTVTCPTDAELTIRQTPGCDFDTEG